MATTYSYDTAEVLGEASEELVRASGSASPTGAVSAYRDDAGVWQHVPASRVVDYERMGHAVVTVYVEGATSCECGEWSGGTCEWSGSTDDAVIVEWMPEHYRASHRAAGNRGTYPANGARRICVSRECADLMIETDGEWCSEVAS